MIFMIPTLACYTSVLNLQLLKHLIRNFDVLLLLTYTWTAQICLMLSLRGARLFTCGIGLWGMTYIILIDASPDKIRLSVGKSGSVGVLVFISAAVIALFLGSIPGMYLMYITMGETIYSTDSSSLLSGLNCCMFYSHKIYESWRYPNNFAILTSKMKSVKVVKENADILADILTNIKGLEK